MTAQPESEWVTRQDERLRIVSDDLWNAARAARQARRDLWHPNGPPSGGRPAGVLTKYLLSAGVATCGLCHRPLMVDSRDLKRRGRRFLYTCSTKRNRGGCKGVTVPMEQADQAVLTALREDVFDSEVAEVAVEEAIKALQVPEPADPDRKSLEAALATVELEIAHCAEAIATTGPLPSLLDKIKVREERRAEIKARLEVPGQDKGHKATPLHGVRLKKALQDLLKEWTDVLRESPEEARGILTQVLETPITFTPEEEAEGSGRLLRGRFEATTTLGQVLRGLLSRVGMVTPGGNQRFRLAVPLRGAVRVA